MDDRYDIEEENLDYNESEETMVKPIRHVPNRNKGSHYVRATNTAGNVVQTAGTATQAVGKTARVAGGATKVAGAGLKYAGKGLSAAGSGLSKAGSALSSSGLGAIVGVPLSALGVATNAVGKAGEVVGTGVEKTGDAVNKAGKSIDNTGKKIKSTGRDIKNKGKELSVIESNLPFFKNKKNFGLIFTIGGIAFGFIFVIFFLLLMITPLMSLGIIDIEGLGSDFSSYNKYANLSFSYCNSVNVDGELYSLEDYVAGVVDAEAGEHLSTGVDEALKVQAIVARTYVLSVSNGGKVVIDSSVNDYAFNKNPSEAAKKIANDTAGLVLTYKDDLFMPEYEYSFCFNDGECSDSVINDDGSYTVTYTVLPSWEKQTITLSDSSYYDYIDFENVSAFDMIKLVSYQYAKEGMKYDDILEIYSSSDVEVLNSKNMLSGIEGTEIGLDYIGTYTNLKTGKTYKNYKQYLYATDAFDFKGKDHLASVGCGTTSTAIILSGEDSSISPKSVYIDSGYAVGVYFGGGRYTHDYDSFSFCASWDNGWCRKTNSKTMIGNKDTREKLISNLSEGGTAVLFINYAADQCLVNGQSWTSSQHFFTALDYNPVDDTIYISNPGNNSDTKNGWIPLDYFDCVHVVNLLYPE